MRRALALWLLVAAAAAAQPDDRRPPLYVAERDGAKLYLLGSIHVLPEGALPLPAHVERLFDAASVVAFETVEADGAGLAMLAAAADEATIAELLAPAQLDSLHAALREAGWPGRALDDVEPWFGALRLSGLGPDTTALGEGVDAYLYRRALTRGKDVRSLETPADQLAAFDDVPDAEQVAYLMGFVGDRAGSALAFEALVAAWGAGDEGGLWTAVRDELGDGALYETLLLRRNRAWLPTIRALLDRPGQVSMVVVGAGHLVGPGSVVALLRAEGVKVRKR